VEAARLAEGEADDLAGLTPWEKLQVLAMSSVLQNGYFTYDLADGTEVTIDYRDR